MTQSQNESKRNAASGTRTSGDEIPVNQLWRWGFRINAIEPYEPRELWDRLIPYCREFYFQLEEGETGYMHWQGCMRLNEKERLAQAKDIIGNESAHLYKIDNWAAKKNYVTKSKTRVAGPWSHESVWIKTITNLYPWQKEAERIMLGEPDDRTVFWIWDSQGNMGKTAFCKYMIVKHGASVIGNGKSADISYALKDDPKIVLLNLTRTVEGTVNYAAIESIKDGLIFSGKYESRMKVFNPPHVFVFANFAPVIENMSEDRWEIVDLRA